MTLQQETANDVINSILKAAEESGATIPQEDQETLEAITREARTISVGFLNSLNDAIPTNEALYGGKFVNIMHKQIMEAILVCFCESVLEVEGADSLFFLNALTVQITAFRDKAMYCYAQEREALEKAAQGEGVKA